MPITEAPPNNQQKSSPTFSQRYSRYEEHELHFLLEETADERDRSRIREAIWISVILHMVALFALIFWPKFMPKRAVLVEQNAAELEKNRQLTYLDLPKDNSRPVKPTKPTNVIADKDRLAQTPMPDAQTLKRLLESRRAGNPGVQPQNIQSAQQPAVPQQQVPQAQPQQTVAQLEQPQQSQPQNRNVPNFKTDMSAGSNIQQAARNSAHDRSIGTGGDLGVGQIPHAGLQSGLDVLSDTMGVDFDPYLKRVVHDVRLNWYNLIPEEARPPLMVQGKVAIQFAILKDGSVSGLSIVGPSGDIALDRAAQGGITGSNPFPPLPSEFGGQYLLLRFYFYYNPKNPNELN